MTCETSLHKPTTEPFVKLQPVEQFAFFSSRRDQLHDLLEAVTAEDLQSAGLPEDIAEYFSLLHNKKIPRRFRAISSSVISCSVDEDGQPLSHLWYRPIGLIAQDTRRRMLARKPPSTVVEGFMNADAVAEAVNPTLGTLLFETLQQAAQINHGNVQVPVGGGSVEKYVSLRHAAAVGYHALNFCERSDGSDLHLVSNTHLHRCA